MKKILFIIADLCSRGAEHQMVTVACLLKHEGYDVSFLCYHKKNFFEHILKDMDIPIKWLKNMNCIRRMFVIRKIVRNGTYDAVISFLSVDNFLNDFSAWGGHKWKVITGERSSKESMLTSCRGRIFALFQKCTDFIICNSENARKMWIRHYPRYNGKLRVIYNNVQLPIISSQYDVRHDNRTNIIVAGAYAYVKDPINLIHALSELTIEARRKIHIDWYGKINCNKEAEDVLKVCQDFNTIYKLDNIIQFHDATEDIANRMNEADIVALFSRWEGLPNAICEGMAIGKPILMTRISDYGVLVDERNGWLCDSGFPTSIAHALETIIQTTDSKLLKMGRESKRKADILFSNQKILSEWLELVN